MKKIFYVGLSQEEEIAGKIEALICRELSISLDVLRSGRLSVNEFERVRYFGDNCEIMPLDREIAVVGCGACGRNISNLFKQKIRCEDIVIIDYAKKRELLKWIEEEQITQFFIEVTDVKRIFARNHIKKAILVVGLGGNSGIKEAKEMLKVTEELGVCVEIYAVIPLKCEGRTRFTRAQKQLKILNRVSDSVTLYD